ncbi:MAG TPA: hypothetical protein VHR15_18460 [Ktedonobacterales bacterium]|nr:hypothetical protein [Ktedonobacterales bacterium]
MWRGKGYRVNRRLSMRAGFTTLLLIILSLLAACGSSSVKAKVTPVPPTATPLPKGWNAVASPPVGSEGNLTAVAALSTTDVWAVGSYHRVDGAQAALIEHWDGSSWAQIPSPTLSALGAWLTGVATFSANDVWAVGGFTVSMSTRGTVTAQLIEHWDGKTWTVVPNPALPQGNRGLGGVAAIASNDVWAVGSISSLTPTPPVTQTQPLVEHWDGSAWKVIASPTFPIPAGSSTIRASLAAISGISARDVWAVGEIQGSGSLIEHWDGSAWKIIVGATPSDPYASYQGLSDVAAIAANDVWAVGPGISGLGTRGCGADQPSPLMEHWNGSRWLNVPIASPGTATFALSQIAGSATNDVWAVGGMVAMTTRTHVFITPIIEHWDGVRWSISPNSSGPTAFGLAGVAARPGVAWAVGQGELTNGHGPTIVQQWNGSRWAQVTSPSPGTLSNELEGVTALAAKDVWAVGSSAAGTLSERWDGISWRVVSTPNKSASDNFLRAVAGSGTNDVWAVGSAFDGKTTQQSLVEHWDGSSWSLSSAPSVNTYGDGSLYGVAAITPRDAWMVGAYIAHWDGSAWKVTSQPQFQFSENYSMFGVAAVAPNDVWAVGGQTTTQCGDALPALIEHWDGAKWTRIANTPIGILRSVSAVSATDVWAVGDGFGGTPLALHWDGKKWSLATSGLTKESRFVSVSAHVTDDVWAISGGSHFYNGNYVFSGEQILLWHWDGKNWKSTPVNCSAGAVCGLRSLAMVSAGEAWAVGASQTDYPQQQAFIMRYLA